MLKDCMASVQTSLKSTCALPTYQLDCPRPRGATTRPPTSSPKSRMVRGDTVAASWASPPRQCIHQVSRVGFAGSYVVGTYAPYGCQTPFSPSPSTSVEIA